MSKNKFERIFTGITQGKCPRVQLIVQLHLKRPFRAAPQVAPKKKGIKRAHESEENSTKKKAF